MTREIVFHLGDCKTGSTSIQRALAAGAIECRDLRIGYPSRGNHNPLAHSMNRKAERKHRDARWAALRQRIDSLDCDVAVVSAEVFEFSDPEDFSEMLSRHLAEWRGRYRFIAYIRPHAERLISAYAERTKQGFHTGPIEGLLDQFEASGMLHFAPRIARWKAVFGDAYEVRPMIRDRLKANDVVADFADWLVEQRPHSVGDVVSANESLTAADLAALREIYVRLPDGPALKTVRKALGWNFAMILSTLPRPKGSDKPRLHAALAPKVVETYRADAAEIDRLYFQDRPMSQALESAIEKALPEPQPIEAEAYFDANALRFIHGTAGMLGRIIEADPPRMTVAMRPPELRPTTWPDLPSTSEAKPRTGRAGARSGKVGQRGGAGNKGQAGTGPGKGRNGKKAGKAAGGRQAAARPALATRRPAAILRSRIAARLPWPLRHRLRPLARLLFPGTGR